jgi:hypothetical protein
MPREANEIVPAGVGRQDLIDESNRRAARAGYYSRSGEPLCRTKIMNNPPTEQYRKNYARIFGHD